jgi:hypothetical protein
MWALIGPMIFGSPITCWMKNVIVTFITDENMSSPFNLHYGQFYALGYN